MDPLKQAEYLTKLIAATVISPNEAREKLDMNPYDGGDSYSNPAITVAETPENDDEIPVETGEEVDETGAEAAKRAAIVSRLRHLIGIEQQRVQTAMKSKAPIASLDKFYGKWNVSLASVCEELGGTADHAAVHCQASQDALLTLLQTTSKDSLADAVGEATATWGERAEELATNILRGNDVFSRL
jgi:hypothetical protein